MDETRRETGNVESRSTHAGSKLNLHAWVDLDSRKHGGGQAGKLGHGRGHMVATQALCCHMEMEAWSGGGRKGPPGQCHAACMHAPAARTLHLKWALNRLMLMQQFGRTICTRSHVPIYSYHSQLITAEPASTRRPRRAPSTGTGSP